MRLCSVLGSAQVVAASALGQPPSPARHAVTKLAARASKATCSDSRRASLSALEGSTRMNTTAIGTPTIVIDHSTPSRMRASSEAADLQRGSGAISSVLAVLQSGSAGGILVECRVLGAHGEADSLAPVTPRAPRPPRRRLISFASRRDATEESREDGSRAAFRRLDRLRRVSGSSHSSAQLRAGRLGSSVLRCSSVVDISQRVSGTFGESSEAPF